jgi:pimeloyl-ACP methyl ester carboxylesterase
MSERAKLPSGYRWHDVEVSDGRRLEVLTGGPDDAFPFVFHSGTPSGAAPFPLLVEAAAQKGFRTIMYSRPGYGRSSPARGRTVSDAAADTAGVLDHLGHGLGTAGAGRFVTCGWSGGGPHTLACAALLPDRCVAAAVIAGVAPSDVEGLDWTAGMGAENLAEFEAARWGGEPFDVLLQSFASEMANITEPAGMVEALGDLVSARDKHAINQEIGVYMIAAFEQALLDGVAGWRDDDLAFLSGWGFDATGIETALAVWQGTEDRMVPLAHGQWIARHVPNARLELAEGEGHVSVVPIAVPRILDDFRSATSLDVG